MARKTPIEKLSTAVEKILADYADDVKGNIDEITERVGKAGVTALRSESKQTFPDGSGKYAKGWKAQVNKGRLSTDVVIYNETPGLPHLLEYGHAKRGGGRVAGRAHIAPVEEKLVEDYQREVLDKL